MATISIQIGQPAVTGDAMRGVKVIACVKRTVYLHDGEVYLL